MSSGYQAGGQLWVGFDDCDEHIATEGASCPHCKIESLKATIKQAREALIAKQAEWRGPDKRKYSIGKINGFNNCADDLTPIIEGLKNE